MHNPFFATCFLLSNLFPWICSRLISNMLEIIWSSDKELIRYQDHPYFAVNLDVKATLNLEKHVKIIAKQTKISPGHEKWCFKGRKIISGCHIGLIRLSFIENYGVCECTLSRRTFQFVSYLDLIVHFLKKLAWNWQFWAEHIYTELISIYT